MVKEILKKLELFNTVGTITAFAWFAVFCKLFNWFPSIENYFLCIISEYNYISISLLADVSLFIFLALTIYL
jgi:hypothetical protein